MGEVDFNPYIKRLLESSALASAVENFPDAIYIGGTFGIPICNKKGLELLGYNSIESLNQYFAQIADEIQTCHPGTGKRLRQTEEPYYLALVEGKSVVRKVKYKHLKTGREMLVRCAAAPIYLEDRIIAAIAINTDLSEKLESA